MLGHLIAVISVESVGLGLEREVFKTLEHAVISHCISFIIIMTLVLVRDYTGFPYVPQVTPRLSNFQVTGASGFVGSHVVDELLRQGYSVRGYA